MPYNILFYSMSSHFEWRLGVTNRNRQLVECWQRDPRVGKILMVDFLPYSFRRAAREVWKARIWEKDPNTRHMGWGFKLNQESEKLYVYSGVHPLGIAQCVKKLDFGEDFISLSSNPMDTGFLIQGKGRVFDAVDDWRAHPAYAKYTKRLDKNYAEIAQKSDLIFTVSDSLRKVFTPHKQVHWIPNGVDLDHFGRTDIFVENFELDSSSSKIPHPIAGYVGQIQDRVDLDLVAKAAGELPQVSFVFIGKVWDTIANEVEDKFKNITNVHFLGPKDYSVLPKYIQAFDIGLIPHKINDLTRSMNPLKLYEYLAAGKRVLTTPVEGVKISPEFVIVAKDAAEFISQIKRILAKPVDSIRVQSSVQPHSWSARVDQIFGHIDKILRVG
ncbi:MAG: UDP-glycosyl transferase/glycogen phosphorylase [Parcubacteria group bacterium Gr01-1014_18]|nr:MAG: UDP-glycosyl transferase/glycogen phosphorylase [Parcubacteria group bacterium Greene0416_36]TSC80141.1 MAG: UDP-glycosyl transferase/glycogen phosphorylase [Parcubacteria group bacterium Gr01-1014_18]TSC99355.1 MAG: UDP-glycosyl transferase/glycogen phosphorylase [Parcubacteria group bacterium Greene1014_20]TSD06808.1 MAG: UDP-glycosyl transferase/glycogen phosphorylase [Parcubacteria group bacterium Greene0714_2]